MTKQDFFRKLQIHLWLRVPGQKRRQIIADYQDFFNEGLTSGETEQALCERFGAPREIAAEIAEREPRCVSMYHVAVCVVFLVLFFCVVPPLQLYFANALHRAVLSVISIALTLLLAGRFQTEEISPKLQGAAAASLGIGGAAFGVTFALMINIFVLAETMQPEQVGPLVAFVMQGSAILVLGACVITGFCAPRLSVRFLPFVTLSLLLLAVLVEWIDKMSTMMGTVDDFVPLAWLGSVALLHVPALLIAFVCLAKRRTSWTRK